MTLAVVLFGYAVLVAALAPRMLNRAWALRSPRLAIVLWQAAAASVLAGLVLAGISCVTAPGLVEACLAALTGSTGAAGVVTVAAGLLVPGLLFGRLAVVAVRHTRAGRADRRRHLELLGMLGRRDSHLGVTVIPGAEAAAYCVPGTGAVVLSRGALDLLEPAELRAILAHERAHLTGRHHLLIAWASILAQAIPAAPVFRGILPATLKLVELLADDRAVRRGTRADLAAAIAAFTGGAAPTVGLAASGGQVLARVHRLLDPPPPLPLAARLGGASAAASLLAVPVLLAVIPAAVAAGLAACPLLLG